MTPFHQKFFINKSLQDILQRNENIARKKMNKFLNGDLDLQLFCKLQSLVLQIQFHMRRTDHKSLDFQEKFWYNGR